MGFSLKHSVLVLKIEMCWLTVRYIVPCRREAVLVLLQIRKIDFMSLDVEGSEIEILSTMDFQLIRIDVLMVEYRVLRPSIRIDGDSTAAKLKTLDRLLIGTGLYRRLATIVDLDVLYVRLDISL